MDTSYFGGRRMHSDIVLGLWGVAIAEERERGPAGQLGELTLLGSTEQGR